jgi:hypothetical protein
MTAGMNKFLRIYYARVKEVLNALDESETELAEAVSHGLVEATSNQLPTRVKRPRSLPHRRNMD